MVPLNDDFKLSRHNCERRDFPDFSKKIYSYVILPIFNVIFLQP